MRAAAIERRKRAVLTRAPLARRRRDRLDAGQALGRVGLKAHLRLLAVADHVDAGIGLLPHDRGHRRGRLARERGRVIRLAGHAGEQQRGDIVGARQAARMGGQDSLLALVETGHANLADD
jgi:hypothetical protein